jgi:predicted DsbA family dithiol-disulfide isomerase
VSESIKIDIWSDIACPWCYIGKRKFEAGAAAFAAQAGADAPEVTVEYHSFELAPDTPVDFDGSEIYFLSTHKGMPADQVRGMLDRVTGIAGDTGLDYNFDTLKHTNTVKAHQLLHYAKARGLQLEAKERLLKASFTEGRHVGRVEDLADLAAEIGLDHADVVRSLEADEHLDAVRADQALGQEYGIQGVPFFVIDGKYGVSGAQEAATFAQVLEQVWGERLADAEAEDDESVA